MSDIVTSLIRTYSAQLAAIVVAFLVSLGLDVDVEATSALVISASFALYYFLVRLAEQRWPAVGVLLGRAGAPGYTPPE